MKLQFEQEIAKAFTHCFGGQYNNMVFVSCILSNIPVSDIIANPFNFGLQNLSRATIYSTYSRTKRKLKDGGFINE